MRQLWLLRVSRHAQRVYKHVTPHRVALFRPKQSSVASRGALLAASFIGVGSLVYASNSPNAAFAGVNTQQFVDGGSGGRGFFERSQRRPSQALVESYSYRTTTQEQNVSKIDPKESETNWGSIGDTVTNAVFPEWAKALPAFIEKLQRELAMEPGTLADEMWQEAHDPEANPEILWDATVRISDDLCSEEKDFLRNRKFMTTKALAKYLDIPEEDIDPEDVPTIAMCGSGGGLRALVAGASSYFSAKEAGLFDCVTYTAGVSGSCWMQALYYSNITGQKHENLLRHLKNRLGVHIAYPPPLLKLLTSAPTNKFLLCGGFEKYKASDITDFGLVDLYGLLLGARLLVPKGELGIDYQDLKVSNQRQYVDDGSHPLPIYTVVRHEIPAAARDDTISESARQMAKDEAWFQWFETTPYEFWCEELQAGIPTWAMGRRFDKGRTVWRPNGLASPELRVPLMMGVWGSAFCATLSHYYQEIRPLVIGLAGLAGLDQLITERNEDLVKVHPIEPACVPNFLLGLDKSDLPSTAPQSIFSSSNLQLMDAGMSNNLPIYPLLRPGRDVDILIIFDTSADVRSDNWLRVADGYARQRGIKGWPIGTGWADSKGAPEEAARELDAADQATAAEAGEKLEQASREQQQQQQQQQQERRPRDNSNVDGKPSGSPAETATSSDGSTKAKRPDNDLGYCTVWVGTTEERSSNDEPPLSKKVEEDWQLMAPDAGIAVVYFPFLANAKVEGVDPQKSDFMSTWNFIYTPEEVDKVVALAKANFEDGEETTKMTVRAVYERRKKMRREIEARREEEWRQWGLRLRIDHHDTEGNQGDHFS